MCHICGYHPCCCGSRLMKELYEWSDELKEDAIKDIVESDFLDKLKEKLKEFEDRIGKALKKTDGLIYQRKLMEAIFGMGEDQIFPGAENAPQGLAYAHHEGKDKIFILVRVEGSSWTASERHRIVEFELAEDGQAVSHLEFSHPLNISHQGLTALVEDGKLYLYSGMSVGDGDNSAKGLSKIEWKGSATSDSDVKKWQLFGHAGSDHPLEFFNRATPAVSTDGRFVIMACQTSFETNTRYVAVYDRKEIEQSTEGLTVAPLSVFKFQPPPWVDTHIVQDIACDGHYIYILTGYTDPKQPSVVNVYELNGNRVGFFPVELSIGDYTREELEHGGTLGTPYQMEPEGIAIKGGNLLALSTDVWRDSQGNYTRRGKVIHELTSTQTPGFKPLNRLFVNIESPASVHIYGTTHDVSFPYHDAFQVSAWDENTKKIKTAVMFSGYKNFNVFDTSDGATDEPATFFNEKSGGRDYAGIRANTNLENGAGINVYGKNDSGPTNNVILYSRSKDNTERFDVRLQETGQWRPGTDDSQSLGTAGYRWKNLYLAGTVRETSDRNQKEQIENIPDEVLDAWAEVNYVQFKYKKAVAEKGDKARKHIGLIAQQIYEVFTKHGLDPFEYGILGYDEWEEQQEIVNSLGEVEQEYRPAGSAWNVSPEECQYLELALLRRELNKLKGVTS